MFTAVEIEYMRSLVESMNERGYKHYVARTITASGNNNDLELVFSRDPIRANNETTFSVTGGVRYTVDSSGYSTSGGSHARVAVGSFSGTYTVPVYEFVYTNADFGERTTIQPDIRLSAGGVNNVYIQAGFYVLVLSLLVTVLFRLFRSR